MVQPLVRDRSYHLVQYRRVVVGSEVVAWLAGRVGAWLARLAESAHGVHYPTACTGSATTGSDDDATIRAGCVRMVQEMVDARLLRHVFDDHDFRDAYLFYRFAADEAAMEAERDRRMAARNY
jgi:hypothetical protein